MKKSKENNRHVIKYFVGYDCPEFYLEEREVSTAAITKATYICKKLIELGYDIDIVSNATSKKRYLFFKSHKKVLNEHLCLYMTPSFGRFNRISKVINRWLSNIWLIIYGLRNLQKNETILVYHGIDKIKSILFLKKIKQLTLILEVEELYKNVGNVKKKVVHNENKIIDAAEKYILITNELNELINKDKKEYCVLNGTYDYIGKEKQKHDKIKLVYAGTFNSVKGGVYQAIDCMQYLPDNYELDVLGFGAEEEVIEVKEHILKKNNENIVYIGLKRDEEFLDFLMQCDIGLSTQKSQGDYNNTSFPSKILTYICCGLKVVSVDIPVVKNSKLENCITFYSQDNPKQLADAILRVDYKNDYCKKTINELDEEFKKQLYKMLVQK